MTAYDVVRFRGTDEEVSRAWRAERRKGVGGSDVAAIMGLSAYRGPYSVWAEKTGLYDPPDISSRGAVEWGNRLEPVVARKYAESHPDRLVRRLNGILRRRDRPWAQASLDYEVRDPSLGWGVLEIKTVGLRRAADWEGGVPVYYQTQAAHYMSVTGRPFCDVAVLVGGQEYREHRLLRDPDDVAAVERAVDSFWLGNVVAGTPPEPCGADQAALLAANPPGGGSSSEGAAWPELSAWLAARADRDAAQARLDDAAARLKGRVGGLRSVDFPGGRLSWSRQSRRRLDREAMERDHPGLYEGYCVETETDGGLRWSPRKEG